MLKKVSILLLGVILLTSAGLQRRPDAAMEFKGGYFVTDNLGNVYTIQLDRILKYDPQLHFMKEFSNKNFGAITSADVTNLLRPVLFYREFGRVLFLDNTLSQNGEPVALEGLGYPFATLVASSHDNGLWIYNQANFELIRLNQHLQEDFRTGNLTQVLGMEINPNFLLEKDNHVFLNNPETGIIIFDVFGSYIKNVPERNLQTFQVSDEEIVFFNGSGLIARNFRTGETRMYEDPIDSSALNMRMEKNAVYHQTATDLRVYNRK